ncbi:BUD32 family EKC/KEOPS complex subunit [Marinobacter fonticola]|uniref:hypothetical protein n=1 Tax=Marinobacter fonticola TaxID=2603215 RepID=UPI0011E61EB4|nr:hypothetical protein [Marinobacter fonticola]
MNTTDETTLEWHAEEQRFLQKNGVIGSQAELEALSPLKSRWIHNTRREVYITPSGYVLKRFCQFPGRKDFRRVWRREHRALARLEGLSVPRSLGYMQADHSAGRSSVLYVRSCLAGDPLEHIALPDIPRVADLFATFHNRGVVTLDPQPENFLHPASQPDTLAFIDFGRARVYNAVNPLLYISIGKEMLRLTREGRLSDEQLEQVLARYAESKKMNGLAGMLIHLGLAFWRWRYRSKDRKRAKRKDARS